MFEYSYETMSIGKEYLSAQLNAKDLDKLYKLINKRAADGWDLVTHSFASDSVSNMTDHVILCTFRRKKKSLPIRNLHTTIPLRPHDAYVYTDGAGNIFHSIFVEKYEEFYVDSINATVWDYDVSGNLLYETNLTATNLGKYKNGFSFISGIDSNDVDADSISYLEVHIEAIMSESDIIKEEFLCSLRQLTNIPEIKKELMHLKGLLPDDEFYKALNYLKEIGTIEYSVKKMDENEKKYLRKLLQISDTENT